MKTVFVVNPMSGKKNNSEKICLAIKNAAEKLSEDVEIYLTKAVGDARDFVNEYCKNSGRVRFVVCGGDGTLGEVVNGAAGFDGVEIGIIPCGTGNDFSRNFCSTEDFYDVEAQLLGETQRCDVIKYKTVVDGVEKTGYCMNMFNIGFDCNVADMTNKLKNKRFITGKIAYVLSIFMMLVKKKSADLEIEIDGEKKHSGKLLLTSIANGSFCGGGIMSNPLANLDDGFADVNIVKNVSRLKFVTLLPYYMKGTHLDLKNIDKIISSVKAKKITVTPKGGKMRLCADGEISDAGRTEFEILHDAVSFVVPSRKKNVPETVRQIAMNDRKF